MNQSITNQVQTTSIQEESFDLMQMEVSKSVASTRNIGEEGVCTIINSSQNGNKRLMLSSTVHREIGAPSTVKIGFLDEAIVMGEVLPIDTPNSFEFRGKGNSNSKRIIYNAALVQEVTEKYELDYSNGRTSITFPKVIYQDYEGYKLAIIKVKK